MNSNSCCVWIQIHVVFEFNFMLCLSTIVYCIIQWMFVIVHLVRMAEPAQYQDVVTHVPVGMDSLGISVKVSSIFILLCVLRVNTNKFKRSWLNYWEKCLFCSNSCCVWIQIHVVFEYKFMLCLIANSCCVWIQMHVVFEYKYMCCLNSNSCCVWVQIHVLFEYKYMLCLIANTCVVWIQIHVVFEYKFM